MFRNCLIAAVIFCTALMSGGCGLELSADDVNGIGVPPLAALPPQPAAYPGPPLPLGAQSVLFAQPAPNFNFNANTPVFIPGVGVIYTRP